MATFQGFNFFQKKWLIFQKLLEENLIQKEVLETYKICYNLWFGNVLDIGCGSGERYQDKLLEALKSGKIKTYSGIDLEPELIKKFEEKIKTFPPNIRNKISLKVCDIYNISTEKKFNYIMITGVYDHLKDQEKFLGLIKNLIRKDSPIFLNEFNEKMDFIGRSYVKLKMWGMKIFKIPRRFKLAPHIKFSFLAEVIVKFKNHGFKIKGAKETKRGWYLIVTI